nr:hypothetical protein [Tanacetum cinerariifolium]
MEWGCVLGCDIFLDFREGGEEVFGKISFLLAIIALNVSYISILIQVRITDEYRRKQVTRNPRLLVLHEWTGSKVQEEIHHDVRPTLQRLPFYYTHPAPVGTAVSDLTPEDLTATTPSTKVLAKDEASKKRRASNDGDDEESDDDHDACVEIPLVTPIRSVVTIPRKGYQSEGFIFSDAEASQGKLLWTSLLVLFTYERWEDLYEPTLSILSNERFKDPRVCKIVIDQFPTLWEMVQIKALFNERLAGKISVLHSLLVSHGGELLAQYIVQRLQVKKFPTEAYFLPRLRVSCLWSEEAENDTKIIRLKASPLPPSLLLSSEATANSSGNNKKDVEPTNEVSKSNLFDVLNTGDNDIELDTNKGTSNLSNKWANSSGSSFWNVENSSTSTTPITDKIGKYENLIIDGQAILMDEVGNPLKKVEYTGDRDSEYEVASVDNDMAPSMA